MATVAAAALLVAVVLALLLYRRLSRLRIPSGAGLWTTLRGVPFGLVVMLDLLDLSLDLLSAPLVWWLLGRLRLQGLREVATVQALVPFSGPIPVMTLAWLAARVLPLGDRPPRGPPGVIDTEETSPGRFEPSGGRASARVAASRYGSLGASADASPPLAVALEQRRSQSGTSVLAKRSMSRATVTIVASAASVPSCLRTS